MRIEACFDSHVHWQATGEFSHHLRLEGLTQPSDIAKLNIEAAHYRGEWLMGFGWSDTSWNIPPNRKILDEIFPTQPVAFSRCDGHALWVNTEALNRAGLMAPGVKSGKGGRIVRDSDGLPTGVLVDQATEQIDRLIPKLSAYEIRRNLLKGVRIFHEAGFTHIRDMTCDEGQWFEAINLDRAGLLNLAVEEYFWLKNVNDAAEVLEFAKRAKSEQTENLRVKGIKLFLDGALGSEGAWISKCYPGSESHGLVLWEKEALAEVMIDIWRANLEVAIHSIGDQATSWLIDLAHELKAGGNIGPIHLEHAEIIRNDSIEKMRGLNIECHMQPAHWLSDRHWLSDKVGDLARFAFPWRRLQESDIHFDFGSDSPIEPASFSRTLHALEESASAGVPRLLGLPSTYMGHRDLAWAPNSFSVFEGDKVIQVVFRGENLI